MIFLNVFRAGNFCFVNAQGAYYIIFWTDYKVTWKSGNNDTVWYTWNSGNNDTGWYTWTVVTMALYDILETVVTMALYDLNWSGNNGLTGQVTMTDQDIALGL